MSRRFCHFVFLLAIVGFTASLYAADWPQWRGPKRDGLSSEKGLLTEWEEKGPPLVWDVKGCGSGYSSVAVANGRVFTIGKKDGAERLFAFDIKDGKQLWATEFGTGGNSNGSPVVDGDRVYAIGLAGDLVCCDTATGKALWTKRFDKDFGGKMMSGWGFSESPLIDGDRLICTPGATDAMMVALNKMTGDVIWKSPLTDAGKRGKDGAGYSSIVVSNGAGVKQYVQMTGRGVIGVRADDGKLLWVYNEVANGTANIPTPIISGDYVFCSTGYGTGAGLLKLSKDGDGVKANEEYFLKAKTLQNHHGGMLLIDGHIYCGHAHNEGFPICVEMSTGKVVWGGETRGPGKGSAAATYADGHLIFRYEDGILALIEATPAGYKLKGSFKPTFQQGKSWAHPVISDGRMYLREQDHLMVYDLRKQAQL